MNKQSHRIVFNASRGCLMAVAETTTAQGKSASGERTGRSSARTAVPRLCSGLAKGGKLLGEMAVAIAAIGAVPMLGQAQTVATRIVADPMAARAQQAIVLGASNGVVQVNIQTPSAAGVSRNTYSQFDVGSQGAILNNSRTNAQTQLGGWVQGNPWLATGSARVILNEVNASSPSQLQGYVEVAGQRAEVVIANPAGIAVNGGGFINASGVTLTTGTVGINSAGVLDSYRVQQGSVNIDGKGLDTGSADFTAILSRATQVNAGIWAKQLQVLTGANDIQAASVGANTTPQTTALNGAGTQPAYALDVSQLGGMYAGKITLIGTEAGLGVRNAGVVQAASGPLTLSQEGWLSNSGTLQASGGNVTIQTRGAVNQSGTVYSDKNVRLASQDHQTHSGTVAAQGDVNIQATGTSSGPAVQIAATNTTVWAAGLQADGQLVGQQNLSVQTDGQVQSEGKAVATGKLSMQGASLDISQSALQAATAQLQARTGALKASGSQLLVKDRLELQTPQAFTTDGAKVQAGTLSITANSLSNVAGQLVQSGSADQAIALQGILNNSAGIIQSAANNFDISALSVDNTAGQLLHAGTGTFSLSSQGLLRNNTSSSTQTALTDGARIVSNGSLNIAGGDWRNSGSAYAAHDLTGTLSSLSNGGTLYAAGHQILNINRDLANSGTIAAAKNLTVTAASVAGTSTHVLAAGMAGDGALKGTGALTLSTTGITQSAGQLLATGQVNVSGASLDLRGVSTNGSTLVSIVGSTGGDVGLTAINGNILTTAAQVNAPGQLTLTANTVAGQTLDNSSGLISGKQLQIHVGQLDNTQGLIQQTGTGVQAASLQVTGVLNNTGGSIQANALDASLHAGGALTNTDGQVGHAGTGTFALYAGGLANTRGHILGNGTLVFTSTGQATNASGLVAAQQTLNASATGWDNSAGKLLSVQGDLALRTTQNSVTNSAGLIQSARDLRMILEGAHNSLLNQQGKVYAGRDATLSTGTFTNDAALVAAARTLTIDTHGQDLSNLGSRSSTGSAPLGLIAGGSLDIRSGAQDNRAGLISAQAVLDITSSGALNNAAYNGQASQIYSGVSLNLRATGVDNSASQILAVQDASINLGTGSLTNTSGLVRVGQTLTLQADSVLNTNTRAFNTNGSPKAMGLEGNKIQLNASNLDNTQGAVRTAQDLTIQSDGQLTNDRGELSAGRNLLVTTAQLTTPGLRISNAAGQIVADQSVSVRTGSLSGAGTIASQGDVSLSLQGDHTLAGTLQAGGNLSLSATGQVTNPISVQAGKNLTVSAQNLDNQATGELLSVMTTQLNIADTLTNRGLIDGADTRIRAATVNNLGTGRIYGDRVAIAAAILNNQEENRAGATTAATLAGRERVDIGVQTLTNREAALIYSGGDLDIGGALDASWRARETAEILNNNSATIEAAQNLGIQAVTLRNTNEHFASEVQQISQASQIEYQGSGAAQRYLPTDADVYIYNDQSDYLHTPEGNYEQWTKYDYTRTVNQSVVTQSAPAKLLAGGGITLLAGNVLNDKSQIVAGGTLSVQATSLNNLQAQGSKTTTDVGTATSYWRVFQKGTDTTGSSATDYAPAPTQETVTLSANRYEQNTAHASAGTAPSASMLSTVNARAIATSGVTAVSTLANLNTVAGTQANAATATAAPQSTRGQSGSALTQVRTAQPNTQIPNTSLYKTHPDTQAKYLLETDPQFTQYKTWLGSDYMLGALQVDPATSQKRLGDGFYEQKLVRDQVLALTGQRFLGDYRSDEQEYKALMDAGLTYAKQWNLRPGIALTAEQTAQLTSDMVWLVSQEVTLADGSVQSVLMPQVYVRMQPGDLDGSGALLAGKDVNINLSGEATNSGTVAGRKLVQINASSIQNLGGQMSANILALQAQEDIHNVGGLLQAQSEALLSAGRDIHLRTTTQSSTNKVGVNSFSQTGIDRVAGLYVSGPAGVLIASAGRDLNLTAAQISNVGSGPTQLAAGHNLNLNTVTTANSQSLNWDANNRLSQSASQDVGSQVQAAGLLSLRAGRDINAKAATVSAGQVLNVSAGNSVNITAGQTSQSLDEAHQHTSKGFLSSKTVTTRDQLQSTTAIGSSLEGSAVNIAAGKDLRVQGSSVLADQNVELAAGGNVDITAAQNTLSQSSFRQETKRGLMSGGGLAISVGSRMQSLDQGQQQTTAETSTVGSTGGNVRISAGQSYTQTGSDVLTPQGNIDIAAKSVTINEARETGSQSSEQKFKQSGLTLAVTSPVISAVQGVQQQAQAASNTGSERMKALAAANATMQVKQGAAQVQDALAQGDATGGVGISLSVGASSSKSQQQSSADTARGSQVTAGGNINIAATGDGQNSNLTVQGSDVKAVGSTSLQADNQVNLLAAQNTTQESSSNQSSSASLGVAFKVGGSQNGFGVTASASLAKGQGAGNSITFANSHIEGGQQVAIASGADTTLKGATVTGKQVSTNVGGDLNIQSLQDQSQHREKSQSVGGSVMIGAGGGGSLSLGQTKINSDYLSVGQQSAIRAGDGGFAVKVQGKTDLKSAQITSTQAAIDQGKNSFTSAGGTQTQDLQNSASYEAKSASIGLGAGGVPGQSLSAGLSGVGLGSDKGSAQSTTTAGISGVAGNAAARTGDASTSLKPIFDAEKVKKEIEAQVTITQEFNKQAGQAITNYASDQRKALQERLKNAATDEEKAQVQQTIKDVNMQERALNILVSALTGMAGATVSKEALSTAAEKMRDLMIEDSNTKKFAGVVDSTGKVLSNVSGPSDGVRGDGVKVGGTRVDLDLLCGPSNERCLKNDDGNLKLDSLNRVQFDEKAAGMSLAQFLNTPQGKEISGLTGGVQGAKGTLFGIEYPAGSWQDKLVESFAGTHDFIGGKVSGLYDDQGNIKRGMSTTEKFVHDRWAEIAIPIAAPFAAAEGMSPEIWKAIGILLGAGR
jgi:filamentous hemagglutinin